RRRNPSKSRRTSASATSLVLPIPLPLGHLRSRLAQRFLGRQVVSWLLVRGAGGWALTRAYRAATPSSARRRETTAARPPAAARGACPRGSQIRRRGDPPEGRTTAAAFRSRAWVGCAPRRT